MGKTEAILDTSTVSVLKRSLSQRPHCDVIKSFLVVDPSERIADFSFFRQSRLRRLCERQRNIQLLIGGCVHPGEVVRCYGRFGVLSERPFVILTCLE